MAVLPNRGHRRFVSWPELPQRQRWLSVGVVLLFAGLPIHLVLKAHLPGLLGTYWKDALSLALVPLALAAWPMPRLSATSLATIQRLWRCSTSLDKAVGLWCMVVVGHTILMLPSVWPDHRTRTILLDGTWLDLEFMPLYLAGRVLVASGSRGKVEIQRILTVIQWMGLALGVGAFVETYLIHRPLFPSSQQIAQFGDPAVYVAATHILRPYVTFDFPVGLGAYLAACLVLHLGSVERPRTPYQDVCSLLVIVCCGIGLLLTHSRGPWIGATAGMAALAITAIITHNRRLWRATTGCILAGLIGLFLLSAVERATPLHQPPIATTANSPGAMTALTDAGVVTLQHPPTLVDQSPPNLRLLGTVPLVHRLLPQATVPQQITVPQQKATPPDPAFLRWTIDGITLPILFEHPPILGNSLLQYRIHVPPHPVLVWSIALSPQVWAAWKGDGVTFTLALGDISHAAVIFRRYIDPKHDPAERHWATFQFPLALVHTEMTKAGDLLLNLMTNSGPWADARYDWAAWGDPHVVDDAGLERRLLSHGHSTNIHSTTVIPSSRVTLSPISVQQSPAGVTIGASHQVHSTPSSSLSHLGIYAATILDWSHDASNQSRIGAWKATLHRWLQYPWLGSGAGTSDEIATRFATSNSSSDSGPHPVLITESQPLKELVENGIAGLLAWMMTAFALIRSLSRRRGSQPDADDYGPYYGPWAAAIVLLVISVTFQVLEVKQVAALWWFFLGILNPEHRPRDIFRAPEDLNPLSHQRG